MVRVQINAFEGEECNIYHPYTRLYVSRMKDAHCIIVRKHRKTYISFICTVEHEVIIKKSRNLPEKGHGIFSIIFLHGKGEMEESI